MQYLKKANAKAHEYYNGTVKVTEFNFSDDDSINDAIIELRGRYPDASYAVNDVVTVLVSAESGSGILQFKDDESLKLEPGDWVLIKPGDAYYFDPSDSLTIRYTASPAWTPDQADMIE